MKHRLVAASLVVVAAAFGLWQGTPAVYGQTGGLLPDLVTVVPTNFRVETGKGASVPDKLRFTNVIANIGAGPLQIRGYNNPTTGLTEATQEILNANNQVVATVPAGTFEFHPGHNHYHLANLAKYVLRAGTLSGTIVASGVKVSFCLIDLERIFGKLNPGTAGPRTYTSCGSSVQGITEGWGDEYFYALAGQELVIEGLPAGIYYLISVADAYEILVETDENNNDAWVKLQLSYVNGTPTVAVLDHSPCTGNLCGGIAGLPKPFTVPGN